MKYTSNKANQEPILGGMNIQLFAGGSEGSTEGQEVTDTNESEGTKEDTKDNENDSKEPDKTFTQDELNAIVTREARTKQEKILKDLGIEDFKDAKEGMKKFKEWQDSQKTEAEKKEEKLTNLEKEHLFTKQENEFLKAQLTATKQGVRADSVEDVVTLAQNLVSDEVDMDGAIKKVIEKYPHFAELQEEEEDKNPYFSTGQHSKKSDETSDPFKAKLAKYK